MEPIILPRISDQKPLVSVISITYNHEPYIRDCLEGFLMQKTDFPIEIIIHDDASTDHTADILREYYNKRPDLFHVIIEKENQYSQNKPILIPLYNKAQGKYLATCEGDDYWTDPLKLQKQFDFMEDNNDCNFCSHGVDTLLEYTSQKDNPRKLNKNKFFIEDIISDDIYFSACSYFFRKSAFLVERPSFFNHKVCSEIAMYVFLARNSFCYYISDIMATHIIQFKSSVSQKDRSSRKNYRKLMEKCVLFWKDVDSFYNYAYTNSIQKKIDFCNDGIACSSDSFIQRFVYFFSHLKKFRKDSRVFFILLVFVPEFIPRRKINLFISVVKFGIKNLLHKIKSFL